MQFKVICLNLWLGGLLFDQIFEFLEQENPDVLLLQEVYDGKDAALERRFRSIEVLKDKIELPYEFFSPACTAVLEQGSVPAGNAIFSRFPISDPRTIFFDIPFGEVANYEAPGGDYARTPRNLQHAMVTIGGSALNFFNTQGIWGKDSEDNERRLAMSEVIVENIKDKKNVILAGDFNVMPHTKTILNIEQHVKNLFRGKIETTFNLKQKSNPVLKTVVVDMLFASPDLKIVNSYCPNVDVSDHLPLVGIFEVQAGRKTD